MFKLKALILNPKLLKYTHTHTHTHIYIYLKLMISKILNIAFIFATFLLSHINVAFRSISMQLNLSGRLLNIKAMNIQTSLLLNELHEVDYIFKQNK